MQPAEDELYDLAELFRQAKQADVAPVVHGRWVFDFELTETKFYRCSVCNRQVLTHKNIVDDCPYCHCGAKMDEGE